MSNKPRPLSSYIRKIVFYIILVSFFLFIYDVLTYGFPFKDVDYDSALGKTAGTFVQFAVVWVLYKFTSFYIASEYANGKTTLGWYIWFYAVCIGIALFLGVAAADRLGTHDENCTTDDFGTECETVTDYTPSEAAKANRGAEIFFLSVAPLLVGCYKGFEDGKSAAEDKKIKELSVSHTA